MSSGDNCFSATLNMFGPLEDSSGNPIFSGMGQPPFGEERVELSNALDGRQWDARSLAPPSSLVPAPTWDPQPAAPSQAVCPTTEPGRPTSPEPSTCEPERPTRQAQPSTSAECPIKKMDYFGEFLKFLDIKVYPLEASSLEELLEKLDLVLEAEERAKLDALPQSLVEESPTTQDDTMETQETEAQTASTPPGAHYSPLQAEVSPHNMAGDFSMLMLNGNAVNPRPSHGQMTVTSATELCNGTSRKRPREDTEEEPYTKKPRSAFTIYCADQRQKVMRQLRVSDLDKVNFVLSKRWQLMSFKERAVYKDKADKETKDHQSKFPGRTAADNFATKSKKKGRETPVAPTPSCSASAVYCQPPETSLSTKAVQYQPEAGPSTQGVHYPPVQTYYPPVPTHYPPVPTHYPPVPTYYPPVPTYYPPVPTHYPPVPTYFQLAASASTQGPYFLPAAGLPLQAFFC